MLCKMCMCCFTGYRYTFTLQIASDKLVKSTLGLTEMASQ